MEYSEDKIGGLSQTSLCKINLFLRVVGKRGDGYHEIETIFLPLSEPFDKVSVVPCKEKGILISSNFAEIPRDQRNTCWKAADRFAKFANIEPNWEIQIEKKIPVAAGLGGGSGNAAAVLSILNKLYEVFSASRLADLAVSIGADVPFFLDPCPAIARGIGEKLEKISFCPDFGVVLVNPLFPVSSVWAYENRLPAESNIGLDEILDSMREADIAKLAKNLRNDLAPALYEKFPLLEILRDELIAAGALGADISGSGPTIFGIADSLSSAQKISKVIEDRFGVAVLCFASCPRIL